MRSLIWSNSSRTVLNALLREAERLRIAIVTASRVVDVRRHDSGFVVSTDGGAEWVSQTIALCTGGRSLPKTGSDGFGYELARRLDLSRADMLAKTQRLIHGTTVATNALLERKGAKVALLTTKGHRDVIEMREGLKGNRYDLRSPPPEPLVPRELRLGVRERLRPDGEVLTPLDASSLASAIETIRKAGATSVAVCFLHAYRNPAHELQAAAAIRAALGDVDLVLSHEVWPQQSEYERASAAVLNA